VNVEAEIPLEEAAPSDITDQVANYFNLNGNKEEEADEADVVTASFAHE
jgi:hypothetical protein